MKRYLWILALPALAVAQDASVELATPTLGYIYDDAARTLRAIEGVPGAASIGGPMHLGMGLDFIAVAPSRRYAVGYENGSESVLLVRLDGNVGVAQQTALPRARAWFSTSGDAAAFDLGGRIEIWTGLPGQPRRAGEVAGAGIEWERIAVSDDGGAVAAVSRGELYRLTEGTPVPLTEGVKDIAFAFGRRDLYSLASDRLLLFAKADAESVETVASGFEGAFSFAVSRDQSYLGILAADVIVVHLRSGGRAHIASDEAAFDSIQRAEGDAVFQLHTANGGTWLLDAEGSPKLMSVSARGDQ